MKEKISRRDFIKLGAGVAGAVVIAGVSGCIGGGNGGTQKDMSRYLCIKCEGYAYDPAKGEPDQGVAAGTPWSGVPGDFKCPLCDNPKSGGDEWKKME